MSEFNSSTSKIDSALQVEWEEELSIDRFKMIWRYTQALTSPDISTRKDGFKHLIELDVIHKSPLIVYILASKINEVDLTLRAYVINVLANILSLKTTPHSSGNLSQQTLTTFLSQIGTRDIYSLIQLIEVDRSSEENVIRILCSSSCAGEFLKKVMIDRTASIKFRQIAIFLIGQVGYLEAVPDLKRLENRIQNKINSNSTGGNDKQLLPYINDALTLLRAP